MCLYLTCSWMKTLWCAEIINTHWCWRDRCLQLEAISVTYLSGGLCQTSQLACCVTLDYLFSRTSALFPIQCIGKNLLCFQSVFLKHHWLTFQVPVDVDVYGCKVKDWACVAVIKVQKYWGRHWPGCWDTDLRCPHSILSFLSLRLALN